MKPEPARIPVASMKMAKRDATNQGTHMTNRLAHFAIHADDLERARQVLRRRFRVDVSGAPAAGR